MTTKMEAFLDSQGLRLSEDLIHFGIKGMKWGIRRSNAELARTGSESSADAIRAKETLSKIRSSKSLSAVSDSDLNHLINRINTEKRYAEATSPINKGQAQVKKLLSVGDTVTKAIEFSRSPAGELLLASLFNSHGSHASGKHTAPAIKKRLDRQN